MSGRKPRKKSGGNFGLFLVVAVVAAAVGFLAAYVVQERSPKRSTRARPESTSAPDARGRVEALLGDLDPSGTHVDVQRKAAAEELLGKVERLARKYPKQLEVGEPRWGKDRVRATLRVSSDEYPLEIRWPASPEAAPPARQREPAYATAGGEARLALVIDDLGADLQRARALLDLDANVTLAIIPWLAKSLETAHLCRELGRPFLVHMPMEPKGYPKANPGKGALLQTMDEGELRRRVGEAVASLPGAAGLNNHMGSRLTELEKPMALVMEELRRADLFFLDSMTSPKSVGGAAARAAGIGWQKRDVFLDNEEEATAIRRQLDLALERAKTNRVAIAIGHPYPATLEAIREWTPRAAEQGVKLVPVTELVRRPEG